MLKKFPRAKLVKSDSNLGFTGGNTLGLKQAKGEYIVLLNSDVTVDRKWLSALVDAAHDPKVGIVSSKLRYALPFIELTIDSAAVPRSKVFQTIDHSPIGVLVEDIICDPLSISWLVYYKSGFYEKGDGAICTRRTSGRATVFLPFDPKRKTNDYMVTLHGFESAEPISLPVKLSINGKVCKQAVLHPYESRQFELHVGIKDLRKHPRWLIQNAGNVVLSNGYSKDRGNVVASRDAERREHYEEESEYFEKKTELLAACGASCLIKRDVIDNVGFLDGYYFMYYEDVEFSLRAWRAGWKIMYEPRSIGYHKHRATTGAEESAFFLALVERNHLAFVITHFSLITAIGELYYFSLRMAVTTIKFFVFQFMDNESRSHTWRMKFEGRKAALKYIVNSSIRLLKTRIDFNRYWPINRKIMKKMLY